MLAKLGVVLVIHGGAFIGGSPADLPVAQTVWTFRAEGIPAVAASYPLGNPLAAEMTIDATARRYHASAAIGYSAGGTLAEWLAEHGDVRAAAAVAPVSDLRSWPIGPWPASDRMAASPMLHVGNKPSPLLLVHGDSDTTVPYSQSVGIVGAYPSPPGAQLITESGDHRQVAGTMCGYCVRWISFEVVRSAG